VGNRTFEAIATGECFVAIGSTGSTATNGKWGALPVALPSTKGAFAPPSSSVSADPSLRPSGAAGRLDYGSHRGRRQGGCPTGHPQLRGVRRPYPSYRAKRAISALTVFLQMSGFLKGTTAVFVPPIPGLFLITGHRNRHQGHKPECDADQRWRSLGGAHRSDLVPRCGSHRDRARKLIDVAEAVSRATFSCYPRFAIDVSDLVILSEVGALAAPRNTRSQERTCRVVCSS
jgi:hypothetical protein